VLLAVADSQAHAARRPMRGQGDCFLEVLDGPIEIAAPAEGESSLEVGTGEFRIPSNRLVEVGNGLLESTCLDLADTSADVAEDVRRIEPDRFAERGYCSVKIVALLVYLASPVIR